MTVPSPPLLVLVVGISCCCWSVVSVLKFKYIAIVILDDTSDDEARNELLELSELSD